MKHGKSKVKGQRSKVLGCVVATCVLNLALSESVSAQVAQGAPPPPAARQTARQAAPVDYAGMWTSVVTEDWQWRFVTPIVGDYTGIPLNSVGDKLARQWNHDADVKAGQQCKAFGAAGINRLPTRVQIAWVDDETLKLDFDLGTQSRIVHFDKTKQPGARSLQGHAVAEWIDLPAAGGRGSARGGSRSGGASGSGRSRRRRWRSRRRTWCRGSRGSRRRPEGHDQQSVGAVPPSERCAGQRERGRHRVPRHRPVTGRRAVAGVENVDRRPDLSERLVHRQLAVQEGSDHVEVGADAVRAAATPQGHGHAGAQAGGLGSRFQVPGLKAGPTARLFFRKWRSASAGPVRSSGRPRPQVVR